MPFIARNPKKYLKSSVGSGQCVAYVQAAAMTGHTSGWRRGEPVKGANLLEGTAIATFGENGLYLNDQHGKSHAAIYLRQTPDGILVLDQWMTVTTDKNGTKTSTPQPVHERTILFKPNKKQNANGDNYFVIKGVNE